MTTPKDAPISVDPVCFTQSTLGASKSKFHFLSNIPRLCLDSFPWFSKGFSDSIGADFSDSFKFLNENYIIQIIAIIIHKSCSFVCLS